MFKDIIAVIFCVVTVGNLVYNIIGLILNYHDIELKDHYLGFIKVFGYIGLMNTGVQLICRYIQLETNISWPITIAIIITNMSLLIEVLSMIIQYEDRKYAPLS